MANMTATFNVRVASKAIEAVDICSFELADAQGEAMPRFSAGSHIDVHLGNGLIRQYSLYNSPAETHRYLIGVRLDPASRGGSVAMHEQVQTGDILRISSPKNHFALAPEASRSVLLAGGIGVTPLLSMAERLTDLGANFEMHYCTRSRERAAFFERIASSRFSSRVHFHFDDEDVAQRLDVAALVAGQPREAHFYVCGPSGLMNAALCAARMAGWRNDRLHFESFASEISHSDSDTAFEVQIASSGRVVSVPTGQTIVQALAAAGVAVETSCEQGVCGTCLTRVLDGLPDHRDTYLTPAERQRNDQILPCCSRAKSARLVLDF